MAWVAALALGYVLGSIPWGLLLTRAAGHGDIRAIGSGNIGATNVLRTGSKGLAAATLALDALKGAAALLIAGAVWGESAGLAAGFGAMLGHAFPVWLGFRGGKGVATGAGVLLAAAWWLWLAAVLAWLATVALTRLSSAGALAACVAAPLAALLAGRTDLALFAAGTAALIVVRHRENIARLIAGNEPRIGR